MKKVHIALIVLGLVLIAVVIKIDKTIINKVDDVKYISTTNELDIKNDDIMAEINSDREWFYQNTPSDNGKLEVNFLEDSTLISNAKQTMIITNGGGAYGIDVINYLMESDIEKLDYLVITNSNCNYVGLLAILDDIEIDTILIPKVFDITNTVENFIDKVEEKEINVIIPNVEDEFYVGDGTFNTIYSERHKEFIRGIGMKNIAPRAVKVTYKVVAE